MLVLLRVVRVRCDSFSFLLQRKVSTRQALLVYQRCCRNGDTAGCYRQYQVPGMY